MIKIIELTLSNLRVTQACCVFRSEDTKAALQCALIQKLASE